MSGPVSDYITRLEKQLRQRGIVDPRILAESREHLVDAIEEGRGRGLSAADAEQEAFERFGAPEIVATHILEDRRSRKTSIAAAFAAFWQLKWWILVPTVLAAAVAAVTSDFQPARYRAQTTILVVPQRVSENSDRPSVRTRIEDRRRAINQQVRSRERLERIITDFNLYPERRKKDPMQDIVQDMSKAIDVEILNGGDVFRVAFTSDNPHRAMQVTDRLAAYLIDDSLKDRMTLADGARAFLEIQAVEVSRRLRATEQKIVEYKRRHDGDPVRDSELMELTRDYATLGSMFDSLSAKRLEAQIAANLERRQPGEQFRIIDPARVPPRPVGSNRLRAALIGALVGLAAGLLLVVLRRSSNRNTRPPALAQA